MGIMIRACPQTHEVNAHHTRVASLMVYAIRLIPCELPHTFSSIISLNVAGSYGSHQMPSY